MNDSSSLSDLWMRIKSIFYRIDDRQLDALFTLLLLAFVCVLLIDVPNYREDTRIFSITIGIPTAILLVVLLATQSSTKVENYAEKLQEKFTSESRFQDLDPSSEINGKDEPVDRRTRRARALRSTGWTILLFLLITLFGFLPTIFVFLVLYFRYYASLNLKYSIAYAGLMWLGIFVLFSLVLRTRFYQGILWNTLM